MQEFFASVFGGQTGYLCLSFLHLTEKTATGTRRMYPGFNEYPAALPSLEEIVKASQDTCDSYFSPMLYAKPGKKHKEFVNPTIANLWADLDDCHPNRCLVRPSIVIESSPNRYQGIWLLDAPIPKEEAESLSRRIAYFHAKDGADKSGWDVSQLFRIPGTPNHKYQDKPIVSVLWTEHRLYRPSDFSGYPEPKPSTVMATEWSDVIESEPLPDSAYFLGALEDIYEEAPNKGKNSDQVWHVMCRAAELGCTPGQVLTAVLNYPPAQAKNAEQPGWLEADFQRFMTKKWPEIQQRPTDPEQPAEPKPEPKKKRKRKQQTSDFTDLGLAERLSVEHLTGFNCWISGLDWMIWTGTQWRSCSEPSVHTTVGEYLKHLLVEVLRGNG